MLFFIQASSDIKASPPPWTQQMAAKLLGCSGGHVHALVSLNLSSSILSLYLSLSFGDSPVCGAVVSPDPTNS